MAEFDNEKVTTQEETKLEIQTNETRDTSPVERGETVMNWIDKFLKMIKKYSAKKILEAMLFIVLTVLLGLFVFKPETILEAYDEYRQKEHSERMEERTNNTPIIQAELDKLRQQYNISWAAVWELHNSTNNLDGMPFLFASLTYESVNPGLIPIAEQFDNVRLSLYPLSTYLRKNEMWCGSVEDLKEIDNAAYHRAKALGISYLGFKMMVANGTPNALISIAFVDGCEVPDFNTISQSCVYTSYKINSLLTISKEKN